MLTIFVVSDATGKTAERVVRSALVQFEGAETTIVRRGNIRSQEQIAEVVAEAAARPSLILHTLVADDLRRCILDASRQHAVDSMDLMGPILDRLATSLHRTPREMPGLFKQRGEARLREVEAVEFAFRHDDGQRVEDLARAEVVLVGASRTMKTPTMLYLAYRGWFAANIPLLPDIPVPEPLRVFPTARVFCLLQTPNRLLELRHARTAYLQLPEEGYATLASVRRDLSHTQQLAREFGWHTVDATGKSVEEVAQEIVTLLPLLPAANPRAAHSKAVDKAGVRRSRRTLSR